MGRHGVGHCTQPGCTIGLSAVRFCYLSIYGLYIYVYFLLEPFLSRIVGNLFVSEMKFCLPEKYVELLPYLSYRRCCHFSVLPSS